MKRLFIALCTCMAVLAANAQREGADLITNMTNTMAVKYGLDSKQTKKLHKLNQEFVDSIKAVAAKNSVSTNIQRRFDGQRGQMGGQRGQMGGQRGQMGGQRGQMGGQRGQGQMGSQRPEGANQQRPNIGGQRGLDGQQRGIGNGRQPFQRDSTALCTERCRCGKTDVKCVECEQCNERYSRWQAMANRNQKAPNGPRVQQPNSTDMRRLQANYDLKLMSIFTPAQYAKYEEDQKQRAK